MRKSGLAFQKVTVTRVFKVGTIILMLLGPSASMADLDGRTGAYLYDIPIPLNSNIGKISNFNLRYSSRLQFRGRFGYGWCSPLDQSVQFSIDGTVHLNSCGETQDLNAHPNWNPLSFSYRNPEGFIFRFNKEGKLIEFKQGMQTFAIEYDSNETIYIKSSNHKWIFSSTKSYGFIDRISSKHGPLLDLKYKEDLLYNIQGKLDLEFSYDDWKNLTQISQTQKSPINISYDLGFDRVQSIEQNSCKTNMSYSIKSSIRQLSIQQFCSSIPVYSKIYSL